MVMETVTKDKAANHYDEVAPSIRGGSLSKDYTRQRGRESINSSFCRTSFANGPLHYLEAASVAGKLIFFLPGHSVTKPVGRDTQNLQLSVGSTDVISSLSFMHSSNKVLSPGQLAH